MTGRLTSVLFSSFLLPLLKCPRCFKVSSLSLFIGSELGETPNHTKEGEHKAVMDSHE